MPWRLLAVILTFTGVLVGSIVGLLMLELPFVPTMGLLLILLVLVAILEIGALTWTDG